MPNLRAPIRRTPFGATVALVHRRAKSVLLRNSTDAVLHIYERRVSCRRIRLRKALGRFLRHPGFLITPSRNCVFEEFAEGRSHLECDPGELIDPLRELFQDLRTLRFSSGSSDASLWSRGGNPNKHRAKVEIPSHGDLNLTNLVLNRSSAFTVIDWDEVGYRSPWFDSLVLLARVAEHDGRVASLVEDEALSVLDPVRSSPRPKDWRTIVLEIARTAGRLTDDGFVTAHRTWAS